MGLGVRVRGVFEAEGAGRLWDPRPARTPSSLQGHRLCTSCGRSFRSREWVLPSVTSSREGQGAGERSGGQAL